MSSYEDELPNPGKPFETYVLEGIADTGTGIDGYSRDLGYESEEKFIADLIGKKVCDMGSGHDFLALEVALRGLDIAVVSVNPYRGDPSFKSARRSEIELFHPTRFHKFSTQQIDDALVLVDQNARSAFAHDLSGFRDGEFDRVLDNAAVLHYSLPVYRDRYRRSISEMVRITGKGGKLLVGDTCNVGDDKEPWYQGLFDEMGIGYNYIRRRSPVRHRGEPGDLRRIGIEVTKH